MNKPDQHQRNRHSMTVSNKKAGTKKSDKVKEQSEIDRLKSEFTGKIEVLPSKFTDNNRGNLRHLN